MDTRALTSPKDPGARGTGARRSDCGSARRLGTVESAWVTSGEDYGEVQRLGTDSTTNQLYRRPAGAAVILLGLWLAGWITFREKNPSPASTAGSWLTAAILGGLALLWATWIGAGRLVLRGDRIIVYGGGWSVRIPVSQVTGFTVRVPVGYRGVRTELVALDRTGFDRTVRLIPGEPERCPELPVLLRTLEAWCGIDPEDPATGAGG
jgi:hypothetical protein